MRDFAIYYPYIHIQDDTWLKAAALYWPNIGRIVPEDYPIQESRTAEVLNGELGLMVNVSPEWYSQETGRDFLHFVESRVHDLRERLPALPSRMVRDAPFHRVPGTPTATSWSGSISTPRACAWLRTYLSRRGSR